MTESFLLQLINRVFVDHANYCILCLRTEKERRLETPKHLKKFMESLDRRHYAFDRPYQKVCFVCERQAAIANRILFASRVSVNAHKFAPQLKRRPSQLSTLVDAVRDETPEVAQTKYPIPWLKEMLDCEDKLRKQRDVTQLLQTEVLLVSTIGTIPDDILPQPGESRDLYVIPDDAPRNTEDASNLHDNHEILESIVIIDEDEIVTENEPTPTIDSGMLLYNSKNTEKNDQTFAINSGMLLYNPKNTEKNDQTLAINSGMLLFNPKNTEKNDQTLAINSGMLLYNPNKNTEKNDQTFAINSGMLLYNPKNTEKNDQTLAINSGMLLYNALNTEKNNPTLAVNSGMLLYNPKNTESNDPTATEKNYFIATQEMNTENILENTMNFALHPIVFQSGAVTVPSLSASFRDGQLVTNTKSTINAPQIAIQDGGNLSFITDPNEVGVTLKQISHQDRNKSNAEIRVTSESNKTVKRIKQTEVSHDKEPKLRSDRIDWEDKIPMDVISFVDEEYEKNVCYKRPRQAMPAIGICNVTSLNEPPSDVIDLC